MEPNKSPEGLWWALDHIKNDLDKLETKVGTSAAHMAVLSKQVGQLTNRVESLSNTLVVDNGKPSVMSQLRSVNMDIQSIKADNQAIKELVQAVQKDVTSIRISAGVRTPKEVQVEKLKTIGKVGAGFLLVFPGILSFLQNLLRP